MEEMLHFRVDSVNLLQEIADCALPRTMGVLKIPLNIFKNLLGQVVLRAIELNDPKLNILMLELGLYEVKPTEIVSVIQKQKELLIEPEYNI